DGYVHIDDARAILRSPEAEVSEFVLRARDLAAIQGAAAALEAALAARAQPGQRPPFEVHAWDRLSPFAAIANMIDLMTLGIRVLLIAIVLVAVMNVMIMAVYERIREIGTIAAMGTPPTRILGLFLAEGMLLGIAGVTAGVAVSYLAVAALNAFPVSFSFGQQSGLLLRPDLPLAEVLLVGGIVLAVAVVASLQPAWKAARLDPIVALRHV
ncbi:MAG: FtsX-like permease family protein, partial [Acetobacteraceae bacterium]